MNITKKIVINAKTDGVWQTLRSFDRVEQYLSLVQKSEISGNDVGATRICTIMNPDGNGTSKIVEQLQYASDDEKTIKFALLETPFPVSNCLVTIKVSPENTDTELDFSTFVIPTGIPESEVEKIFLGIYQMMASGLEKLHSKAGSSESKYL